MIRSIQVFAMLLLVSVAIAKAQTAIVSGSVHDKNGAVVPGTKVVFKNKDEKMFTVSADASGVFRIELTTGAYVVMFQATIF